MLRWFSASWMLVACLSLACLSGATGLVARSVSLSDIPSGWVGTGSRGAIRAAAPASAFLTPQPSPRPGVAETSPAMMVPATHRQRGFVMAAALPDTASTTPGSLTYLRTARLRL
jgi:hypothetical protein